MTKIECYYDPCCPFCWITCRWLLQVRAECDIDIAWRPFSLALKNHELEAGGNDATPHGDVHRASHRVQRVISRAVSEYDASTIELYSEFGVRYHIMEQLFDDDMIKRVLEAKQLPLDLLAAADDTLLDVPLQRELNSALEAAGSDVGVPTIVFTDRSGKRLGYFGPVLNALPETLEESLAIWDGLEKLATASSFYELKRGRDGEPDVFSAV